MPMVPTALSALIETKMDAAIQAAGQPPLSADARKGRKAMIDAIAAAVIEHIKAAAQINGVAAVGLVSPPGGGPVTGTVILPPGSIL